MLASVGSAVLDGVEGRDVRVEVNVASGLPAFTIVGLPDAACREARDRIRAAVHNTDGLDWHSGRTTVNLAPSSLRKTGSGLDLAIAVAGLVANEQIDRERVADVGFVGELSLGGLLRAPRGALSLVQACAASRVVVPAESYHEAALGRGPVVHPARSLAEVAAALRGESPWPEPPEPPPSARPERLPDMADVHGQRTGRHVLEVAAAGGHNLLMVGPPGAGKTMLARRLPGLLPAIDEETALALARVRSAVGEPVGGRDLDRRPPFRAPHHSASLVALTGGGGGAVLRPGEISRAHGGVLFLDEVAEFSPSVLDSLRQPLEEGLIRVSRAGGAARFPARFLLAAAMNPCPCGAASGSGSCRCGGAQRARYRRRLSGPLLDRFDLRVDIPATEAGDLLSGEPGEATAVVAVRVAQARDRARGRGVLVNADLDRAALDLAAPLDGPGRALVEAAMASGRLTARGLDRVRRVALTVADLAEAPPGVEALALAMAMRMEPDQLVPGAP